MEHGHHDSQSSFQNGASGNAIHFLKNSILMELKRLSRYMVEAIYSGADPHPEMFNLVIRSLPLVYPNLNSNKQALQDRAMQLSFIVKQLQNGQSMDTIEMGSKGGDLRVGTEFPAQEFHQDLHPDMDVRSIENLTAECLQCAAWYAYRAQELGADLFDVRDGFITALSAMGQKTTGLGAAISHLMEASQLVCACAALLEQLENEKLGEPVDRTMTVGFPAPGTIIVAGADASKLKEILDYGIEQGISVFTAGELGYLHSRPEIFSAISLKGHTHIGQLNQKDLAGIAVVSTDWDGPLKAPDGMEYSVGLAGKGGVQSVSSLKEELIDLKRFDGIDKSENIRHQGYACTSGAYRGLTARKEDLADMLRNGEIQSIEIHLGFNPNTTSPGSKGIWQITTGGDLYPLEKGESNQRDHLRFHLGPNHHVFYVYLFLIELAGSLGCSLQQIPYRFIVKDSLPEETGLILGLISMGFKHFSLHSGWKDKVTLKVWDIFQERFNLQIL